MKRRRKGSGTIEMLPDGRFRARLAFSVGGPREDIDGSPFPSREEAAAALDALLDVLRSGGHAKGGVTLRKVAERCFIQRRGSGYASVNDDESRWDTYFEEHELADVPAASLTQGEIMDAILAFRKKGTDAPLALSTRKNILNMLRAALESAKHAGDVETNVLVGATFPDPKGKGKRAGRKAKRRALTWEQYEALRAKARATGNGDYALALDVAVWTGARQGELRALHWSDVHNVGDLKCSCLDHSSEPHIVIRYSGPPRHGIDCSPKGGVVAAVALFGRALAAFETMARHKSGIVFASRLGGYRAKGRLFGRKSWAEWQAAIGRPDLRCHDLRHTCGTWLVRGEQRMGITRPWSLEAVKEHLRHAELRTTEIYADQRDGEQARALAAEARGDRPRNEPSEIGQVLSRLRDLNSRPTVYEHGRKTKGTGGLRSLLDLAWACVEAHRANSPFVGARSLDLAAAVIEAAHREESETLSA